MAQADSGGPVRIHKYPNRRYYDTAASRYVTLEELREMIRAGRDIRVSDSRTGEDLTAKVLAQIVLEDEPIKLNVIPLELLHGLIRANTRALAQSYENYLRDTLSSLRQSQRSVEQGVRQAMGLPSDPQAMLADWLRMMWGPLSPPSFLYSAGARGGAPPAPSGGPAVEIPPSNPPHASSANDELKQSSNDKTADLTPVVEQLRERLAALEARLEKEQRRDKSSSRRRTR